MLTAPEFTFDERFEQLTEIHVWGWGRTTNFDALLRAGALAVAGSSYRPERAYLRGSSGPAAGFERIWGTAVSDDNHEDCEALLRQWIRDWHDVADAVGVAWPGEPYDSGDLENALCVFQEPARGRLPNPRAYAARRAAC